MWRNIDPTNLGRQTDVRSRAVANGVRLGRKPMLTYHQQEQAIKRGDHGEKRLARLAAAITSVRRRFRG
jgi:hypothetical protein